MTANWYVVRSKPYKEMFLAAQLLARKLEVFCPVYHLKPVNPRSHQARPYFPGYLFIHLDPTSNSLSSISWIPGAVGLVAFDGQPASVPEELIALIRRKVSAVNESKRQVLAGLQPGDKVLVEDGPFAGYQGIFDSQLPGNERVRILLDLLKNRQMRVDLPMGMVKRIETKR